MTTTTNRTQAMDHFELPAFQLDYERGTFINTLTGEQLTEVYGVVLGYREDRALWPTIGELPRLPLCVNGNSEFGPCLCQWADFGPNGEAPDCAEELTVLLWDDEHQQVSTLTARRTQAKVLNQWLRNKALVTGILHDQQVTIGMRLDGELHRLTVHVHHNLDADAVARMAQVAARSAAAGFEVL